MAEPAAMLTRREDLYQRSRSVADGGAQQGFLSELLGIARRL